MSWLTDAPVAARSYRIGLFSAPAVSLVPGFASTAVRSMRAVGHRLDLTSRVTCCDASAVSRATEIWGLFFSASPCASLTDRNLGAPGAACAGVCGVALELAGCEAA